MKLTSVLLILLLVFPGFSETTLWTTTVTEVFDFDNDGSAEKDGTHDLTEVADTGGPTYESGAPKQGTHNVLCENANNEYFTLADDDDFDPGLSNDYSIAFWYKMSASYISAFYKATSTQDGMNIRVHGTGGDKLWIWHGNNWSTGSAESATALSTGTWYHIVIAYDYDATNEITVWISASTFGDTVNAEAINLDVDPRNHTGTMYVGTAGASTHTRDKYYDELAWFKGYAVNATEAEEIFNGIGSGGWREVVAGGARRIMVIG